MLGDKFKNKEAQFRSTLPSNSIVGMRLDGKSFHTFTKRFKRPYDETFMNAMDATALNLVQSLITNAHLAYVQSDEISVIFSDGVKEETQFFFNGKIEKILSVSASAATGAFMKALDTDTIPMFDARLFLLNDVNEVEEYLDWRRLDARKNSISMAAGAVYSHKSLHGKNTTQRAQMLKGTDFEVLPEQFFNGRLIVPEKRVETLQFTDKRTNKVNETVVERKRWAVHPAKRDFVQEKLAELFPAV